MEEEDDAGEVHDYWLTTTVVVIVLLKPPASSLRCINLNVGWPKKGPD